MAGYREFQTGEVLTAANVNDFLMEQAVMTFADDAARTTALTDVLREGLLTYNLDTNALERYDGSAWGPVATESYVDAEIAAIPEIAGIGSNVVQTVKTDTFTTTSSSYTTVTGLSATITPTSNTAKVLIIVQVTHAMSAAGVGYGHFRVAGGNATTYVGDASGSRIRGVFGGGSELTNTISALSETIVYVDSPASASATTYQLEVRTASTGSVHINRSQNDGDNAFNNRGASSITLIEVAV